MVQERKSRDQRLHQLRATLNSMRADFAARDESLNLPPPSAVASLQSTGRTRSNLISLGQNGPPGNGTGLSPPAETKDWEWILRVRFGVDEFSKLQKLYNEEQDMTRTLTELIRELDTQSLEELKQSLSVELDHLKFLDVTEVEANVDYGQNAQSKEDTSVEELSSQVNALRTALAHVVSRLDHTEVYAELIRDKTLPELVDTFVTKVKEGGDDCDIVTEVPVTNLRPRVPLQERQFVQGESLGFVASPTLS